MKVSDLIHLLNHCHPDDRVAVSIDDVATESDVRLFGRVECVAEVNRQRLGDVTLICTTDT